MSSRAMRWCRTNAAGVLVGTVMTASVTGAADVAVTPRKLVVLDNGAGREKTVFVAKDPAISKGAGNALGLIGATLEVAYRDRAVAGRFVVPPGGSDGTAGWVRNTSKVAKYVNRLAPLGPTQAKVAVIKPGKSARFVAKGVGDIALDVIAAGAPPGDVDVAFCVDNAGEVTCHCSSLTGCTYKPLASGGAKLVCKTGVGDSGCRARRRLDHFRVYPALGPDGPVTFIADQFGSWDFADLGSVRFFFVPADKEPDGLPIFDDFTHLTCYDASLLPGIGVGPFPIEIDNQFGPQTLTIEDPEVLCMPTEKFPSGPGPLPPLPRDHFFCHGATGSSLGAAVTLSDQFFGPDPVVVLQPFLFCNPADVNGLGLKSPHEHLTCYAYDPPGTGAVGKIGYKDEFTEPNVDALNLSEPTALCVPSQFVTFVTP